MSNQFIANLWFSCRSRSAESPLTVFLTVVLIFFLEGKVDEVETIVKGARYASPNSTCVVLEVMANTEDGGPEGREPLILFMVDAAGATLDCALESTFRDMFPTLLTAQQPLRKRLLGLLSNITRHMKGVGHE